MSGVWVKSDGKYPRFGSFVNADWFSTDGSIRIDYGHVSGAESGPSNTFHTRQITFPILFTVYHTFEPHSLDLIRFEPSGTPGSSVSKGTSDGSAKSRLSPAGSSLPATPRRTSFAVTVEDEVKRRLEDESNDDHCLVSLSVRNVFGVPFEVSLHRKDNGTDGESSASFYWTEELEADLIR